MVFINETISVMIGCMLHDIGKAIQKTGKKISHPILGGDFAENRNNMTKDICDCIYYHHEKNIPNGNLKNDSLAYISCIADNISSGSDRRKENEEEKSQFEKYYPLESIFNVAINKNSDKKYFYTLSENAKNLNIPCEEFNKYSKEDYKKIVDSLDNILDKFEVTTDYMNYLDNSLKNIFSCIPSSTDLSQIPDISLYSHSKTTAAIGGCIKEYLDYKNVTDYNKLLLKNQQKFYDEYAFIIFGAELKGISKYSSFVPSESALKNIRSRFFISQMIFEHYVDEILKISGINSRINIIYHGGDKCYILLPNIDSIKEKINNFSEKYNEYLFSNFGLDLYMTHSMIECNSNTLMGKDSDNSYSDIINKINCELENKTLNKYSPDFIKKINNEPCNSVNISEIINKWDSYITDEYNYAIVNDIPDEVSLKVPDYNNNTKYIHLSKNIDFNNQYYRIYNFSDNTSDNFSAIPISVLLYSFSNNLDELTNSSFKKLSLLKLNADDVMQYISNFPKKVNTISRIYSFSEIISDFFKYIINSILSEKKYKVTVIYSYNDEALIIGDFIDILNAATTIKKLFDKYTCNKMTISAGINIFYYKCPISKSLLDVESLISLSKLSGKNRITVFEKNFVFEWDTFFNIINEKLNIISEAFKCNDEYITISFIHNILKLFTGDNKKLNIARYLYTLARSNMSGKAFEKFSDLSYKWILNEQDRKEFIFALYIFLYSKKYIDMGEEKNV